MRTGPPTLHTPALLRVDAGRRFAFAGLTGVFKIDGGTTENRFAVAYFPEIPPHWLAAPLHRTTTKTSIRSCSRARSER